jgi:protein TonB
MLGFLALTCAGCRAPDAVETDGSPQSTVIAPRPAPDAGSRSDAADPRPRRAPRAVAIARFSAGDLPVYPDMSRRLQEEGVVELRLELLQNGTVRALEVARSSGFRRLDEAALSAAKTWRFNPRTGGGDVEVIPYRVVFRLE